MARWNLQDRETSTESHDGAMLLLLSKQLTLAAPLSDSDPGSQEPNSASKPLSQCVPVVKLGFLFYLIFLH